MESHSILGFCAKTSVGKAIIRRKKTQAEAKNDFVIKEKN
jgi:hypothetical protein